MVFVKHENGRKDRGRTSASQSIKCDTCGTVIELGDVFYSKITKRHGENFIRHFCEDCYEKQFVTV